MDLTISDKRIIERLKKSRVECAANLAVALEVSTKTVQRALAKVDHLYSVNSNGKYVTLSETPCFDHLGLWTFGEACFSKHGNLLQTVKTVVENGPIGYTIEELYEALGTRVHNQVSQLVREGQLTRFSLGRHAVYLSSKHQREQEQRAARQQKTRLVNVRHDDPKIEVPPGLDAVVVIRVLVRLLNTPEASAASMARWLRAREVKVTAAQVHQILDFYELKKTTH